MNKLFKILAIVLIVGLAGIAIAYFVGDVSWDILWPWLKKGLIVWTIALIVAITIKGVSKNNSLQQIIERKPQYNNQDIFYRWNGNLADEIKNNSKLIVAPAQGALIINEGKIVDILSEEGIYPLKTSNIPFVTNLMSVMQGSESEHKVSIYFFKLSEISNLKRGTSQPIVYEDPNYKFPLRFGLFGNYSAQLDDVRLFFSNYVHQQTTYSLSDLEDLILSRTLTTISSHIPRLGYSYLDLDSKRQDMIESLRQSLQQDMKQIGITLVDFRIDGLQFDKDTQQYIKTVAQTGSQVKASQDAGMSYKEYQQLEIMRDAAQNENGSAGLIAGMGVGSAVMFGMSNHSDDSKTIEQQLTQLTQLKDKGLITEEDYNNKKQELLNTL